MQRPIKFRAWDNFTKTMYEVVDISWLSKQDTENEPEWKHCTDIQEMAVRHFAPHETFEKPDWRPASTLILEQFTGLLDKNGKEIYEGDIVIHEHYPVPIDEGGPARDQYTVIYSDASAAFAFDGGGPICHYTEGEDLEVIGNIHEHEHLLTP